MAVFLEWKKCVCGYEGNMDCWTNEKQERVCICPVCKKTFAENK